MEEVTGDGDIPISDLDITEDTDMAAIIDHAFFMGLDIIDITKEIDILALAVIDAKHRES